MLFFLNQKSCSPFDRFGRKNGLLFIPSVGPGYDDTKIRPWNAAVSKDRCESAFEIHPISNTGNENTQTRRLSNSPKVENLKREYADTRVATTTQDGEQQ